MAYSKGPEAGQAALTSRPVRAARSPWGGFGLAERHSPSRIRIGKMLALLAKPADDAFG
jgi:hypothetical protein